MILPKYKIHRLVESNGADDGVLLKLCRQLKIHEKNGMLYHYHEPAAIQAHCIGSIRMLVWLAGWLDSLGLPSGRRERNDDDDDDGVGDVVA